mgnify:CR=1 FL=1
MELAKAMENRRSIRAYKAGTTIEKSVIEELIKAAQLAPSWKNSQTARYYAVLSEEKLTSVKEKCLPEFNRNNCADAPALIVTTFVKNRAGFERDGSPSTELGNEWGAYDLGLQNQNLLLKAIDLGLDTLVMGIRDAKAIREELSIPDDQEVVSVISVGYRNADAEMPKRKEVEQITVFY